MWDPEWDGPTDRVDRRDRRRERREPRNREGDGYSVRVSNMNYHIYPSDLSDLFKSIGGLILTWVDYDSSDRANGEGGALFERRWQAERAVEFDGIQVADVHMRIDIEECIPGRNASIMHAKR